ncbi:Rap/ran-GAP family protein [Trichomonas vaginalis G3]|uniref:Rap/ran-GAP family protein n=1 Tax=Trichomonas vaginalis (strain ATCC PRA-98 / G3) TaxID=412133 RepID=A2D844_TRIV3|nr:GTPase activator protein [Trichomonas vaginalis G3]EAY23477.1 Rap/ran-GAP family protein [Trichomonas vaginalis G3]KAI5493894.1 GTPase activator protein [Trichomonas vaginalis G3]|eukprot:XP_001584463.1 Rap/ran-GAP family protein [Trichomonas vaginalis G3]
MNPDGFNLIRDVRESLDSNNEKEIETKTYKLLEYYLSHLKAINKKNKTSTLVLSSLCLSAIKSFSKTKFYKPIKERNSAIDSMIFDVCKDLLNNIIDDPEPDNFLKIASISIYVTNENNLSKYGSLFRNFISSVLQQKQPYNVPMPDDLRNFFKVKLFKFLNKLTTKSPELIKNWCVIIINYILPLLVDSDIIVDTNSYENYCFHYKLPQDLIGFFCTFFTDPTIKKSFQLILENIYEQPNYLIFFYNTIIIMTDFYYDNPTKYETSDGIQFLNDFFDEAMEKSKITYEDVFSSISMHSLIKFVSCSIKLMSNLTLKAYKTKNSDDTIPNSLNLCRKRWQTLIKIALTEEMLTTLLSNVDEKLLYTYIITFLLLIFDFKVTEYPVWKLFKLTTFQFFEIPYIRKFCSILGIAFAPQFLGLDQEAVEQLSVRTKQKNSRSSSNETKNSSTDPFEILDLVYSDATYIQEQIHPDHQSDLDNAPFKSKKQYYIPPIHAKGWEVQKAVAFLNNLLLFDWKFSDKFFNSFIKYLSYLATTVPLSLQSTPYLIAQTFFSNSLSKLAKDRDYSVDTIEAIALTTKQISSINSFTVDSETITQWIVLIIKYLSEKNHSIISFTMPIAIDAFTRFAPQSYILAIFIIFHMNSLHIAIDHPIKLNFILNASSVFKSQMEIKFPDVIEKNKADFEMKISDKDIFNNVWKNTRSDVSGLVNAVLLSIFGDILGKPPPKAVDGEKEIPFDLYFNAFFAVLLEQTISGEGLHRNMIPTLNGLGPSNVLKKVTRGNIKEIFYLVNFIPLFEKMITEFPVRLMRLIMNISMNTDSIYEIICMVMLATKISTRSRDPTIHKKFIKYLSKLIDRFSEDKNEMIISSSFYASKYQKIQPPPPPTTEYETFAVIQGESAYGFSNVSDEKIDVCFRNRFVFSQNTYRSVSRQNTVDNCDLPVVCDSENEEKPEKVEISKFMTKFFGNKSFSPSDFSISEPEKHEINVLTPQAKRSNNKTDEFDIIDINEFFQSTEHIKSQTCFSFIKYFLETDRIHFKMADKVITRYASPLFNLPPRENLKIGIIYVSDKQMSQEEILSNTSDNCSLAFNSFLKSLGTVVNVNKHKYYNGKLEGQNHEKFPYSIYYDDDLYEVMFHVSTLLPNDENDPQRILKKKHIGNDNIHIIWDENVVGYDHYVITSQFNYAHIIIHKYIGDLYRVIIRRKSGLPSVGPLPEESIVPASSLSALVLQSAIIIDRFARGDIEKPPSEQFDLLLEPLTQKVC